ncbi:MAG: Trk system potassium transporter TrkA [Succinivibrio sp.]
MKIIILGSGDVSIELAKYLVNAGHAVTIADTDSDALAEIANRIDLRVVAGNPASPSTLRRAGAENTELLVATTSDDEANITACCVGQFLFNIPRKIARLRSADYLQEAGDLFGHNSIPIDHIIATEHIVTQSIMAMINLPGLSEIGSFCDGRIIVASAKVDVGGKLLGKSIRYFSSYDGKASVLAIYRNEKYLSDLDKEVFQIDDEVVFCCERDRALSQLSALRKLSTGDRNITISGGTHVADSLARSLSERYNVKLIEADPQRAKRTAFALHDSQVEVYNADPMDMDFMREENLDKSDLYIAATPKDETNIMTSLIIKRVHNVQTLTLIRGDSFADLTSKDKTDIDNFVFPKDSIISALLSLIRQEGVENVHLYRQGKSEAIEFILKGSKITSKMVGKKVESLNLPAGVSLGLVVRGKKILPLDDNFVFEDNDRLIAYLDDHSQMRKLVRYCRPFSFWIPKW